MPSSDVQLTVPSGQNDFLDTINRLTGTLTGAAQGIAGAYSTFIGARSTLQLANHQQGANVYTPTQSELNAINAQRAKTINILTYVGVGVAVIGTLALIYKTVR